MATVERPKRYVPRKNYKELASLQLPSVKCCIVQCMEKPNNEDHNELYRLEVIEDLIHDKVRVRYIGYEGDEWRPKMTL